MIQVVHIQNTSEARFQNEVNQTAKEIDVVDIKYAVIKVGVDTVYSALILYRTNKVADWKKD